MVRPSTSGATPWVLMVRGSTEGQCQSHDFRPHNNFVNNDGARQLAEALKVDASLTTLNLTSNSIGDDGARQLAKALKVNASLTTEALLAWHSAHLTLCQLVQAILLCTSSSAGSGLLR